MPEATPGSRTRPGQEHPQRLLSKPGLHHESSYPYTSSLDAVGCMNLALLRCRCRMRGQPLAVTLLHLLWASTSSTIRQYRGSFPAVAAELPCKRPVRGLFGVKAGCKARTGCAASASLACLFAGPWVMSGSSMDHEIGAHPKLVKIWLVLCGEPPQQFLGLRTIWLYCRARGFLKGGNADVAGDSAAAASSAAATQCTMISARSRCS